MKTSINLKLWKNFMMKSRKYIYEQNNIGLYVFVSIETKKGEWNKVMDSLLRN